MKNIIYYFSGTGNSLSVALSLAEKLTDTKVESIMKLYRDSMIPSSYEHIGFIYPCCYGHPPKVVTDAVKNIHMSKHQRTFLVVMGVLYGQSLTDMVQLLEQDTTHKIQGFCVRMPGNHILGYPAFPDFFQRLLFRRSEKKVDEIVACIQNSTPTSFKKKPSVFEKLSRSLTGENDTKIPHFGEKGTWFYTTDKCNQCGICSKICPVNNIEVSPDHVKWGNQCQQCMACIQWCPQKAVAYPNIPVDRKHYHHPAIGLDQMLEYMKSVKS